MTPASGCTPPWALNPSGSSERSAGSSVRGTTSPGSSDACGIDHRRKSADSKFDHVGRPHRYTHDDDQRLHPAQLAARRPSPDRAISTPQYTPAYHVVDAGVRYAHTLKSVVA